MRDGLTEYLIAWLGHTEMERLASYLERGRRFSGIDTGLLKEQWGSIFRRWVNNFDDDKAREELHDLVAELKLRKVEIPYESVPKETELLFSKVNDAYQLTKQDPHRWNEVAKSVNRDFVEFLTMAEEESEKSN